MQDLCAEGREPSEQGVLPPHPPAHSAVTPILQVGATEA